MHVIRVRGINEALPAGLRHLTEVGQPRPSRAGDVVVSPYPVTTVYERPVERVLFWPVRDANPFFHLFSALWCIAGRNDAAFLNLFVHDYGERFTDNGIVAGAYGHRWRHWPTVFGEEKDQLVRVIEYLRRNRDGRRAVLAMWDPDRDLYTGETTLDVPCNSHIYLWQSLGGRDEPNRLSMTVCCRSNDIIWGAYGENSVVFSVLQEYVAAHLGLAVGPLYQISNNFHAYVALYDKLRSALRESQPPDHYKNNQVAPYPLVLEPETWDMDLALFMEDPGSNGFRNRFFSRVAKPLFFSHEAWRRKDWDAAFACVDQCAASDWALAVRQWLERRRK